MVKKMGRKVVDAGSKVHRTAGAPQELVGQTPIPAYEGSSVGPFAVGGPFAKLSGRRKRMIFLLTTINKNIMTKSWQNS